MPPSCKSCSVSRWTRCSAWPPRFEVKDGPVAPYRLHRRMLPPHLPGLCFVGLVEIQVRWVASVLSGDTKLPDTRTMDTEIARHHRYQAQRYLGSPRYTLEVDFRDYARQLRGDMAHG